MIIVIIQTSLFKMIKRQMEEIVSDKCYSGYFFKQIENRIEVGCILKSFDLFETSTLTRLLSIEIR